MDKVCAGLVLFALYASLGWALYHQPAKKVMVPTSKAQLNLAKQMGVSNRAINFHSCGYYIDIALFDRKIAVEYNGRIWHPDHAKDKERAKRITRCGWKVLLIYADNGDLPSQELLDQQLDKLESGKWKVRVWDI